MIVVDSNIVAARNLTSSLTSEAKQVEEKDPVWIVPVLWRYEFQNILANAIKAKQIKPEQALDIWEKISRILIENECEPSASKVIDLVAQYGITAYDGQFIAVALEMGIPFRIFFPALFLFPFFFPVAGHGFALITPQEAAQPEPPSLFGVKCSRL